MADEKYLANRLKYHTASRIATQTGEALAQALNVDGHIVATNKVWAAPQTAFINNVNKSNTDSVDATNDLVTAFKVGGVETAFHAGGSVWTNPNYPAVRLYENVPMTKVAGSDGGGKFQAFEILAGDDGVSSGTKRITDWIAPTAVADQETGKPVAGYSGIPQYNNQALKLANPAKWAESLGSYEFAYMAGLLTFEPGFTPQDVGGANGVNLIKLTAFKYIGDYADKVLNVYDSRLDVVEAQLGISGGGEQDSSMTERVVELEGVVAGYTSTSTISSAISSEATARTSTDEFLSGVLSGYDTVGAVKDAIDAVAENAAKYKLSAVNTTEGYAATYQLVEVIDDVETPVEGSLINIPKDQFLSAAIYNATTESIDLTFAVNGEPNLTSIPVSAMVHEYVGGNGITVGENDVNDGKSSSISLKLDATTENFLTVGADGLLLSGVQDAIDTAVEAASDAATEGLEALSGRMDTAEAGLTGLSGRMDTVEGDISDIKSTLTGFNTENTVSAKFVSVESILNEVKAAAVSGITASNTVSGSVGANKISLDVKISENDGNAISAESDGLFAQAYKAGDNIAFGEADENGVIPINGTFTFTLSAATDAELGGVKSGGDITVANDGAVTVNAAAKVNNKLTAFGAEYDGSSAISLTTTGDYLSASNGAISLVVDGQIAENNTGLVTGGQIYALASNISDVIETVSGDLHQEIVDAISGSESTAEELSGKISDAFENGKVAVGDGSKLVSSIYSIAADKSGDALSGFGTTANSLATETSTKNYVDDKFSGLEDIIGNIETLLNDIPDED